LVHLEYVLCNGSYADWLFIPAQKVVRTCRRRAKICHVSVLFTYLQASSIGGSAVDIMSTLYCVLPANVSIMPTIFQGLINVRRLALAIAATGTVCCAIPARAADINVVLDRATLVKLPDRVGTVVVGNPLIADVLVQPGGQLVVTGKGYGVTNIIALDRAGNLLLEQTVEVQGPRQDVVVVYRGIERESYSCTPNCERRITLGDSPLYFDSTLTQTGSRSSQAQSNPSR